MGRRALVKETGFCYNEPRERAVEALIHSVHCANGIYFRPAASKILVTAPIFLRFSFLQGKKPTRYRNGLIEISDSLYHHEGNG